MVGMLILPPIIRFSIELQGWWKDWTLVGNVGVQTIVHLLVVGLLDEDVVIEPHRSTIQTRRSARRHDSLVSVDRIHIELTLYVLQGAIWTSRVHLSLHGTTGTTGFQLAQTERYSTRVILAGANRWSARFKLALSDVVRTCRLDVKIGCEGRQWRQGLHWIIPVPRV